MRTALIISALAHALFWGLATLWAPNPLAKPSETPPIMVELVSPAEADEANAKNTPEKSTPEKNTPEKNTPEKNTPEKNAATDQTAATDKKPEPQPAPPPHRPDQAPAAQAKAPAPKSSASKSSASKSSATKSSATTSSAAKSPEPTPPAPTPPKLQQFAAGGWLDTALSLPPSTTSPFDMAESGANLERSEIAAFKAHLQECWKPPASLAAANNLVVVLRISLQPNGALSGEPTLLAASASAAGPTLIQTATRALQQCQPYAFLPADKYSEWRSLDLSFSPAGLRTIPTL